MLHPNLKDALLSCRESDIREWFGEQRSFLHLQLENEDTDACLVQTKLIYLKKIESSLLQLRNK